MLRPLARLNPRVMMERGLETQQVTQGLRIPYLWPPHSHLFSNPGVIRGQDTCSRLVTTLRAHRDWPCVWSLASSLTSFVPSSLTVCPSLISVFSMVDLTQMSCQF